MNARPGWAAVLAALVLAGMPSESSAGWCSALTVGLRPIEPPESAATEATPSKNGKANFQLTCHSCRRSSGYFAGYASFYPSYSFFSGCNSCYPTVTASYFPVSSCYPSVSCYSGCGTCSSFYMPSYSFYFGW